MSLDLDPIRQMIEDDYLDDIVRIRASATNAGGTLDPNTGKIIPKPGAVIYEGPGAVFATGSSTLPALTEQQVADETEHPYLALIPLDAPPLHLDMAVEVIGTRLEDGPRDPQIQDRRFRVAEKPPVSTFAVVRKVALEAWPES